MKIKRVAKAICFLAACVAVGIYLYSHMHAEYSLESKTDKDILSEENENDVSEKLVFPEHFQKEISELLTFDVEVVTDASFDQGFQAASATRIPVDAEKAYTYFMGGSNEVSSTVYENYFDSEWYATPITIYEDKGKFMSISTYDLSYSQTPQINYISNSFFTSQTVDSYNEYLYSKEDNLDFMDRKTAWDDLIKIMEGLGVDMSAAAAQAIYSLDMETMKQEERCIDVNGNEVEEEKNPEWSKSDEGYYYYITQSYQGIPFYASKKLETDEDCITPLRIFQAESGLISVSLDRWFDIEEQEELLEFVSFETIMLTIEEKYSGTIRTNPLTVERAKLYIFTVQTDEEVYTLVPVWVCTIAENHVDLGENAYTSYIYLPINAITGEEMVELENQ